MKKKEPIYKKTDKWVYMPEIKAYFENCLSTCTGAPLTYFYNLKGEIIAIASYDQIHDIRYNCTKSQLNYFMANKGY